MARIKEVSVKITSNENGVFSQSIEYTVELDGKGINDSEYEYARKICEEVKQKITEEVKFALETEKMIAITPKQVTYLVHLLDTYKNAKNIMNEYMKSVNKKNMKELTSKEASVLIDKIKGDVAHE